MTLVIQDDTGTVASPNSYIDADYADNYFSVRANISWAALTTEQKEAALIKAFDHLEYSYKYKGFKKSIQQTSSFPRYNVYIDDQQIIVVPEEVKKAQCELALIASSKALTVNRTYEDKTIIEESKKLDVLGKTVKYKTNDLPGKRSYETAERYLRDLIVSGLVATRV